MSEKRLPWEAGRVPTGYWDNPTNRRKYLRWLGKQLGFAHVDDWYSVRKQDFHAYRGGGLLANYYRDSPIEALTELYPRRKWHVWRFNSTPQGFWKVKKNRHSYLQWLEKQLKIKSPEDWYQVSRADFHTNHGGGLLANYYGDSVYRALREFLPRQKWVMWKFRTVPQGYWKERENRVSYLKWLGKSLGYRKLEDWYRLSRKDFEFNYGESLFVSYYRGSCLKALNDFRPDVEWDAALVRRKGR